MVQFIIKYSPAFLIIIMISLLSCKNEIQTNKNKEKKFAQKFINDIVQKQHQIEFIKYKARRIDTLISGNTRDFSGEVTLGRNNNDSLFKLRFLAQRDSSKWINYYSDYTYFEIATTFKFYKREKNYSDLAFGTSGGQLVATDLLNLNTSNLIIGDFYPEANNIIIQLIEESESNITTKTMTLDSTTLFPNQIRYVVKNKESGVQRSTSFIITETQINNEIKVNELKQLDLDSGYAYAKDATERHPEKLIGKKVSEMSLPTFDNNNINIRSLESNIILLDFWELWCSPCIASLPKIQKIADDYKPFDLITIGIATDNIVDAKKYIKEKGYSFTQVTGNKKLKSIFDINSYPRYILIDQSGEIFNIYYGFSEKIELDINYLITK